MALNKGDVEFAFWVLDQAIYTSKPLSTQDCALIKQFIEALLEARSGSGEQVKSREWRAGIYRKLLDDPEALEQFTIAAIKKFGSENLAQMVAPDLQVIIVNQHVAQLPVEDLFQLLKSHNRLGEVLEYAMENDEKWVKSTLGLQEKIDAAYDEGRQASDAEEYQRGYDDGFNEASQENRRYY